MAGPGAADLAPRHPGRRHQQARVNMHRKLNNMAKMTGLYPLAVLSDCVVYPSPGASPLDFLPFAASGKPQPGGFRLGPTPGAIVAAGGGRFSRRALDNALNGRGLGSEQLLIDFAAAIGAGEKATQALLDVRARILSGPPGPVSSYPCAVYEWVEGRRHQDETVRSWLVEPELDWYDQQLRDEEEAEHRRWVAWVDSLTDDELDELQRQARSAVGALGDLRAELAAYL